MCALTRPGGYDLRSAEARQPQLTLAEPGRPLEQVLESRRALDERSGAQWGWLPLKEL